MPSNATSHRDEARQPPHGSTRQELLRAGLGAAALLASGAAWAAPSDHGRETPPSGDPPEALSQDERWRRRFPQPVLVSDLIGRKMLDQDQGGLGWIETVVTTVDDQLLIAFARRRLLVFRGETVVVPAKAAALLGPFVMILDLTAEQIATLPAFQAAGTSPVDRGSTILMALTKH